MKRNEVAQKAKQEIPCDQYLEKSKSGMYCCPCCGSGKGQHATGALKLYKETNTWFCHACKKNGDVLDLMQEHYGTDYNGALQMAAAELGVTIDPYNAAGGAQADHKPTNDKNTNKPTKTPQNGAETRKTVDYTEYYIECAERLKNSPEAISYLSARDISIETAAALHIGFDPAADPAQSGHKTPRIIIPTTTGHYVGRSIDPNTEKAFQKMNVKNGTPGIFNTAALYSDAKVIFVTEGAFDAMSVCEMGRTAIALNSTSNGGKLLNRLEKQLEYHGAKPSRDTAFVVAFDNDPDPKTAARTKSAAEDLNNGLRQLNYNSVVFNISGSYKDANEALQVNGQMFAGLLEAAEKELTRDFLTDFTDAIQTEAYRPYKTDLTFFDNLLGGGVIQQSLLILMAAPEAGKTALCQQVAEEMAEHGKPVIYFNLEMSREQMYARAISRRLAKDGKADKTALDILQGYRWSENDKRIILEEVEDYRKKVYPFIQYNPKGIGSDLDCILEYLHNVGEQAKSRNEQAPAVVIDYLHLISTSKGLDNQELIKQIVVGLKNYAKDYNTFVIGISATNRASNASGRLTMGSGRDSSNIEYTGDYQLSLNYYAVDKEEVDPSNNDEMEKLKDMPWRQMIIRVLKGRFIRSGRTANVYFKAANNIFYGEGDFMPADNERTPFDKPVPKAGRLR